MPSFQWRFTINVSFKSNGNWMKNICQINYYCLPSCRPNQSFDNCFVCLSPNSLGTSISSQSVSTQLRWIKTHDPSFSRQSVNPHVSTQTFSVGRSSINIYIITKQKHFFHSLLFISIVLMRIFRYKTDWGQHTHKVFNNFVSLLLNLCKDVYLYRLLQLSSSSLRRISAKNCSKRF